MRGQIEGKRKKEGSDDCVHQAEAGSVSCVHSDGVSEVLWRSRFGGSWDGLVRP